MKKILKHIVFILAFLMIVYMLLGTIDGLAQSQPQKLIPLPSLEVAPDYRRYPSISNVHC